MSKNNDNINYEFLKDHENTIKEKGKKTTKKGNKKNSKKDKNGKKKKKMNIFLKIFLILLILGFLVGAIGIGAAVYIFKTDKWTITKEELLADQGAEIYDKDNNKIAALTGSEINKKLELDKMGKIPGAFIAIEDERFYEHEGVDFKRTLAAIFTFVKNRGKSSYGGSTIAQQLVKITFDDDARSGLAGVQRKIREWSRAVQIVKMLGRDGVLNRYLNRIFLGSTSSGLEIRGVEAAANYYFNKKSEELSIEQAAFIAGINHAPNVYNPFRDEGSEEKNNKKKEQIKSRTLTVLGKMKETGKITDEEYKKSKEVVEKGLEFSEGKVTNGTTNLSFTTTAAINQIAREIQAKEKISYSEARERLINSGYKIYTTEDTKIQKALNEEYKKAEYIKKSSDKKTTGQSAMVVIEPSTGYVIGTAGALDKDPDTLGLNRAVSTRQTGSVFKPIGIVGPVLESKTATASTLLYDTLTTFGKNYTPHNDGSHGDNNGIISLRESVKISLNIPMIKLLSIMGYKEPKEFLDKMNIDVDTEREGLALALGTASTSPLNMAAAYAMIANKGIYHKPTFYTKVMDASGKTVIEAKKEEKRVMSEENAFILTSILQDVVKPGGTGAAFNGKLGKMAVAGKTGTTTDAVDRWFCGFTPYYAAACWYGADDGYAKKASFWGTNPAGVIWFPVMKKIHEGKEVKTEFEKPEGVVKVTIDKSTGKKAKDGASNTYSEYFAKDNVPGYSEGTIVVKICKTTGKKAGPYCTDLEEKVFPRVIETEEKGNWTPKMTSGEIKDLCDVHKTPIEEDVPNVVGLELSVAKSKLEEKGFKISAKISDRSGAKFNEVLTQSATRAQKGAEITITYNTSKPQTPRPTNTTNTINTTNLGGSNTTGGTGSGNSVSNTTNSNTVNNVPTGNVVTP